MTPSEIADLMNKDYISATGLGRLNTQDTGTAPNGIETVMNENGILYLSFMLVQAFRNEVFNSNMEMKARLAIASLCREEHNWGYFNRQPNYNTRTDSMDNRVGDCAIAVLNQDYFIPDAMVSHWWTNWGCYNNANPGRFSFETWGQPGEVALYYMAAKRRAPFLFALWLFLGIFISAKTKEIDAAKYRLTWLRLWIMDQVGVKGFIQRRLYAKVRAYWWRRLVEKYGNEAAILNFGPGHPVTLFEELLV